MTTITIEGIELPIKATPLAHLMGVMPHLATGLQSKESIDAFAEALFHGIRRAKGEVTLEWLSENIDILNCEQLIQQFLKINGLTTIGETTEGEAAAGHAS